MFSLGCHTPQIIENCERKTRESINIILKCGIHDKWTLYSRVIVSYFVWQEGFDTHMAFKLIREKLLGKSSTRKQNVFCYWSRMQS